MTRPEVHVGDRVRDPLDGRWRTVTSVNGESVHMADGGIMGINECTEIRLPGDPIEPSPAQAAGAEIFKVAFVPGAIGRDYAAYAAPVDWDDAKVMSSGAKMSSVASESLKQELWNINLLTSAIMKLDHRR